MSWPVVHVSCVVEGHGEREAVPALVRRIAQRHNVVASVSQPIRVHRSKVVKEDELRRAVTLAAMRLAGRGGVLVLIDADDDCPAELGPKMLAWAVSTRSDIPVAVVLAKTEFEAWFLAAAASIAGRRGLYNLIWTCIRRRIALSIAGERLIRRASYRLAPAAARA